MRQDHTLTPIASSQDAVLGRVGNVEQQERSGNKPAEDNKGNTNTPLRLRELKTLATVSANKGVDPLAARLMELRMWLGDDLTTLEEAIVGLEAIVVDEQARGQKGRKAAQHLLRQRGKRLRPVCVMLAARAGGLELTPEVRNLAVACEMVHAATLLHDDVLDEGTERRGAAAARMVYGNSASVLGGDHLLVAALKMVADLGKPQLLSLLLDVIAKMVTAEVMQLERRDRFDPDPDAYLQIIEGKTAELFRFALIAGGTLGGLDAEVTHALGQMGLELGRAFQLVDDVLDLTGDPDVTGKNAFVDLREGKLTWPFIVGAERDEVLAGMLRDLMSSPAEEPEPGQLGDIVRRLQRTGAIEETRRFAVERGDMARRQLAHLPEGKARQTLEMVVEAAILRVR